MIRKMDSLLNYLGASIRWCIGFVLKIALGQENFKFQEFLNGFDNKNDIVGQLGHRNVNRLFAAIVVIPLFLILYHYLK